MDFRELFQEIQDNRNNHQAGYYNCIPFRNMERTERYLVGLEQATYYNFTANSGVGKSKFLRHFFIHSPCDFVIENPQYDIKLDILYFSLEESKKKILLSELSKHLHSEHGVTVSVKELQSRGRHNTISSEVLELVRNAQEYLDNYQQVVKIYDNIRNPTGIYKTVRDFALTIGTYYDAYGNPLTAEEVENVRVGRGDSYKKVHAYRTYHPRHYVLILVDHISLLDTETLDNVKLNQHQTIGRFSNYYCLKMRDNFGFTPIVIQQQASDKERIETNFRGETLDSKLEPSLDGLANNKETQRDANIVLGLFAPNRYGILSHSGYDLQDFGDYYRSLLILKDRDGIANKKVGLFFNGAIDFFRELPSPDNIEGMNAVKAHLRTLKR